MRTRRGLFRDEPHDRTADVRVDGGQRVDHVVGQREGDRTRRTRKLARTPPPRGHGIGNRGHSGRINRRGSGERERVAEDSYVLSTRTRLFPTDNRTPVGSAAGRSRMRLPPNVAWLVARLGGRG